MSVVPFSRFEEVRERRRRIVAQFVEVAGDTQPPGAVPASPLTIDCAPLRPVRTEPCETVREPEVLIEPSCDRVVVRTGP
jgi:hypothetical protein